MERQLLIECLLVTYVEACDSCIVGLVTDDNFQAASCGSPAKPSVCPYTYAKAV